MEVYAMPTSTDNRYRLISHVEKRYYPQSAGTNSIEYLPQQVLHRYKLWNDAEHRPKPEDLTAESSMTGSLPQTTYVVRGPIGRSISRDTVPGGYRDTILRVESIFSTSPFNMWVPPHVDLWGGDFRAQVEAKSVQISEMLAEADETVRQLYYLVRGLFRGFKSLVTKKKFDRVKLRDIPASILQYNFGVAPLVEDVYSLVEAMRLKLEVPLRLNIPGYTSRKDWGQYDSGAQVWDWYAKRSWRWSMWVEFDPTKVSILRLGNPAEWIWERIPFSFMVDYAWNIGAWIGQFDALNAVKTVYGTVTMKDSFTAKSTISDQFSPYNWDTLKPGHASYSSHERIVINSGTVLGNIPFARFPKPHFPKGSWRRLLNTASVLGVMRSHPRYNYYADWFR
jgi:hypothetical protein